MSKRVLIVDDEKNMRWVLGQSLSGEGFEVAEAADGKEALAAVAEQEPDVMVLDHRMPAHGRHGGAADAPQQGRRRSRSSC